MKQILLSIALTAALGAAGVPVAANAEVLLFSYSEPASTDDPAGIDFTFELSSSNPTPDFGSPPYETGLFTGTSVQDWTVTAGNIGDYLGVDWSSLARGGGFNTADFAVNLSGPQIYGGSEASPTFAPGTYNLVNHHVTFDEDGVLTVTAIPEPSTWAMMLIGFAGLGLVRYAVKRRKRAVLEP